jgi:hypothetical protein
MIIADAIIADAIIADAIIADAARSGGRPDDSEQMSNRYLPLVLSPEET